MPCVREMLTIDWSEEPAEDGGGGIADDKGVLEERDVGIEAEPSVELDARVEVVAADTAGEGIEFAMEFRGAIDDEGIPIAEEGAGGGGGGGCGCWCWWCTPLVRAAAVGDDEMVGMLCILWGLT